MKNDENRKKNQKQKKSKEVLQKHTAPLKNRKASENKDDAKMEKTTTRLTEHKQKERDEAANAVIRVGCVSLKIN